VTDKRVVLTHLTGLRRILGTLTADACLALDQVDPLVDFGPYTATFAGVTERCVRYTEVCPSGSEGRP
jgi:hypothetical protein